MSASNNILTAIDIGSTHITGVMAALHSSAPASVLGVCRVAQNGVKRGQITNLETVSTAFQNALDELERQTGTLPHKIRMSLGSEWIRTDRKYFSIQPQGSEFTQEDLLELRSCAQNSAMGEGQIFLHLIPGKYDTEIISEIENPIGLPGKTLGTTFLRISAPKSEVALRNKLCRTHGVVLEQVVSDAIASAQCVLGADEIDLGICAIHIGHQNTHVTLYSGQSPIYCATYPMGSDSITRDLSIAFHTSIAEAERLKRDFGLTLQQSDFVSVQSADKVHNISRAAIHRVINARACEILDEIKRDLTRKSLLNYAQQGFVLSGGGALLRGYCLLAESVFSKACRLGIPHNLGGVVAGTKTPQIATCIGMLDSRFGNIFNETPKSYPQSSLSKLKEKFQFLF